MKKNKTLIFHLGCSAGFFSEYLEMIAAIVYCKMNNIDFKIYSNDANFSIRKGWTDFFEPFCNEVQDDYHHRYNLRFKFPSLSKLILRRIIKGTKIPTWCWSKLSWWYLKVFITSPYYKYKYNFNYYTHDIWKKIQENKKRYSLDYIKLEKEAIQNTWRFNLKTRTQIEQLKQELKLPDIYIGTQIRAGDKSTEQDVYNFVHYMDKIRSLNSGILDVFILTDDYSIILNIEKLYPEYRIYTLCNEHENGYDNGNFQSQNSDFKHKSLLRLFTSVEILWQSSYLVAAINANPSLFLYKRKHTNSYWLNAD